MDNELTAISLFAGCGGSDLGLATAGFAPVWANEISEPACQLYETVTKRKSILQGDIRDIRTFPKVDVVAGCYPCQGYSQGGRRKNDDGINFLYQEFDRALRQVKPLGFIVENVDGMRFSQNCHLLKNQLTRFRLAGYSVSWKVLDAKDFGLAQDRKRLFIVGVRRSEKLKFSFPQPTHGPGTGRDYTTLKKVIWDLRKAPLGSYNVEPFHWYYLSRNRRPTWGQQSACVVASWRHVGLHPDSAPLMKTGPDHWHFTREGKSRRLSYLECAAIQGFPDPLHFNVATIRERFRAIGNAVPPPLFAAVASAMMDQIQE